LVERTFLLGRSPQLEKHVCNRKPVRNRSSIIVRGGFGPNVAAEQDQVAFIDGLRDEGTPSWRRIDRLRLSKLEAECKHRKASEQRWEP
jgi:hypothetical protein